MPKAYLPDTYLPFAVPGFGLIVGIVALTLIGALAANLLGRTLISFGEQMVGGMPIVRNVYRALKQIFESVITATGPGQAFQKVGLIEFPSKGLWSIVFVTGETTGEVGAVKPGGEIDLLTVFMPTGIVPPTGFVCFLPRRNVTLLDMNIEDAAKVIISAGMVTPESQAKLRCRACARAGRRRKIGRPSQLQVGPRAPKTDGQRFPDPSPRTRVQRSLRPRMTRSNFASPSAKTRPLVSGRDVRRTRHAARNRRTASSHSKM